jgi:hypothetical protein
MRNENRTPYFDLNGTHVAAIGKNGSSAIGRAIHYHLNPDYVVRSASGNADMVEKVMHNPGWQALAPKTFEPVNPIIPVRDPVERFRSACAQEGRTAADAIQRIQDGNVSFHFKPVTDYLKGDSRLYKFPEHIAEIATELGLNGIEEVNTSATNNGPKPDLTEGELEQVQAIYADDIALYESITEAGQVWTAPPAPEPEPEPLPLLTAEQHIARELGSEPFVALRISAFQDLEVKLLAASKTAPKLAAMRAWIDGIVGLYATDLQPRNDWPSAPHTFEETVQEAAFILSQP